LPVLSCWQRLPEWSAFKVSSRLPRVIVAVAFVVTPVVIVAAMAVQIAMGNVVPWVVVKAANAASSARDAVPIAIAALVDPVPMEVATAVNVRRVKLLLRTPRRLHPNVVIRHREVLAVVNKLRQE